MADAVLTVAASHVFKLSSALRLLLHYYCHSRKVTLLGTRVQQWTIDNHVATVIVKHFVKLDSLKTIVSDGEVILLM